MPSERLRKLEIDANTAFDQYREMYFEEASPLFTFGILTMVLQELFLSKRLVTGTQRRSRAAGTRSM
jgi:hypothetical protein